MATNSRLLRQRLLTIVLLFGLAPLLAAQSAGYFIVDTEEGEPRFVQRLAWSGEYALRYEVILEREVDGVYRAHMRDSTSSLFIEVSLPPGRYRFRVIPYDILDKPGEGSEWKNIEVRRAVQPEIYSVSQEYVSRNNRDGPSGYVLTISGNNFVSSAEIFILGSDGVQFIPDTFSYGEDGGIIIFVDSSMLPPGEYEIVIRNPGGLEAGIEGIVLSPSSRRYETALGQGNADEHGAAFEPLKTVLASYNIAWMPVLPVHGEVFGFDFSPAGISAHFNAVFFTPLDIYIGAELTAFLYITEVFYEEYENVSGILSAGLNLLAMKWLSNERMALNFRIGAFYILLPDFLEYKLCFDAGASFTLRVTNKMLLEIGLNYTSLPGEYVSGGCIRLWVGIGGIF